MIDVASLQSLLAPLFPGLTLTTETPDTYLAFFSPTPGDERVVAFVLNQYFLQQRPLLKEAG